MTEAARVVRLARMGQLACLIHFGTSNPNGHFCWTVQMAKTDCFS